MTPLDDLCEFIVDCEHKTAPLAAEGYPSIRTPNIGRGVLLLDGVNRVSQATYEAWTRRAEPQCGDLILAREAPVGNVAVVPDGLKCCLGQRTVLIRPKKDKVNSDYLCYLLLTPAMQSDLVGKSGGATVHHLNLKDIRALPIPELPEPELQSQLAARIKVYDDLIENNRRRIALLEESARLLYREWFVHLRFPEHDARAGATVVPEGWSDGCAADFVRVLSGGTPDTKNDRFWGGDIPFFTPKDCKGSVLVQATEKSLTEDGLAACNSPLFPKMTIFITARGTVGKLALAQQPMAMNQSCYALAPKSGVNNLFLFLALEDRIAHLKTMASGGVFDAIVVDTFKKLPFLCPPAKLADDFGSTVLPVFEQIENLLVQNARLTEARDALLPKLMSGEITV